MSSLAARSYDHLATDTCTLVGPAQLTGGEGVSKHGLPRQIHTHARAVRNRKHMHTNCLPSVAQTHSVLGKLSGPFARDVDGHLCELLVNVDVGVLHKAACTLLLAKQTLAVVRAVGVHADRAWVALVVARQTLVNVWQVKKK